VLMLESVQCSYLFAEIISTSLSCRAPFVTRTPPDG
jgi:hypothetical protein